MMVVKRGKVVSGGRCMVTDGGCMVAGGVCNGCWWSM
jgi:hypothetical protein